MGPRQVRKKYTTEDVENALKAISENGFSIAKAARVYNIPRQTLSDKVNGKHQKYVGRSTTLTDEEETALVGYIKYMASIGNPLDLSSIMSFAWSLAKRSGNDHQFNPVTGPTEKWWRGFKKRHRDEITLRKQDCLDRRRTRMANINVMNQHFGLLKEMLEQENIFDNGSHIFNVDESGVSMDPLSGKVVMGRNTKHTYQESRGVRDHITINVCCSGAGLALPPMIIFEKKFPSGHYSKSGPNDCLYSVSPNGYMDEELFLKWFKKIFIPNTQHLRPTMLIFDCHASHINLDLIDCARSNNILLYCLPPHTTNILQPLDVAVFKPFKAYFSKLSGQVKLVTLGTQKTLQINKTNFSTIFKEVFEKTMSMSTIKNGFRKTGIYPFNPDAVEKSRLMPTNTPNTSTREDTTAPLPPSTPTSSQLKQKEEEKERRKIERERKKKEREELQKKKKIPPKRQKIVEESSSSETDSSTSDEESGREHDEEDLCGICHMFRLPQHFFKKRVDWIACDQCERWFHLLCASASSEDIVKESYICRLCHFV